MYVGKDRNNYLIVEIVIERELKVKFWICVLFFCNENILKYVKIKL